MHKFFNALAVISALSLLASRQSAWSQESQGFSPTELANRTIHRRAVDAAIWGLPTVSFDSLRQAYFRDAKAKYNDLIWWPKGSSWKNQMLTPNTSVRYVFLFCNTKSDGPVVLELPGAVESASFFGTIEDSWWMPLVDIGLGGKGGKYLILPPNYK